MTALQKHLRSGGDCSVAVAQMSVKSCARSDFGSAKHTRLELDGYADVLQILLTDGAEVESLCSTARHQYAGVYSVHNNLHAAHMSRLLFMAEGISQPAKTMGLPGRSSQQRRVHADG